MTATRILLRLVWTQTLFRYDSATASAGLAVRRMSSVGSSPVSVAVGDFNNDGNQDIAAANSGSGSNTVSIRLGNGTGRIQWHDRNRRGLHSTIGSGRRFRQ